MLGFIRRNKSRTVGTVIIGMCALLMLGFGLGNMFGPGDEQYAAIVDDTKVTFLDFERQRQLVEQRHRQTLGAQFDLYRRFLNMNQEAIDNAISEVVLGRFLDALQLTTSREQIEQQIVSSPFFGGKFTPEKFSAYKQALGLSGVQLENMMRKEAGRQQFARIVQDTSFTPEKELRAIFNNNETKRTFGYVEFDPAVRQVKIELSEAALASYYEANASQYETPRAIAFDFVEFKPEQYEKAVEVTDEDIEYLYEDRKSEFYEPKKLNLSWIKFKKQSKADSPLEEMVMSSTEEPKADESKDKQRALDAMKLLEGGEEFAAVATKLSEDEISKQKGGELGWKTLEELEPAIRTALRTVEPGDFTNVVDTDSGFYIVKLNSIKERALLPIENVRTALEASFRKEEAGAYAAGAAEAFYDTIKAAADTNLQSLMLKEAEKIGRSVATTEKLVSANESVPGVPSELIAKVINLAPGDVEFIELNNQVVVVSVREERVAAVPPLDAVRERVTSDYRQAETVKMTREDAQAFLKQLLDKPDTVFATAASAAGLSVIDSPAVTRSETNADSPLLLQTPDVREKLFALRKPGEVAPEVFELGGKFIIASLGAIIPPDASTFAEKKKSLQEMEQQQRLGRIFTALLATLRAKSEIWTNPTVNQSEPNTLVE